MEDFENFMVHLTAAGVEMTNNQKEKAASDFLGSAALSRAQGQTASAIKTETIGRIGVNKQMCSIEYSYVASDSTVKTTRTVWDADSPIPPKWAATENAIDDATVEADVDACFNDEGVIKSDVLVETVKKYRGDTATKIDEQWLKRAIEHVVPDPLLTRNTGEMILQQATYAPFSHLFHAMDPEGYLADQVWDCPLEVQFGEQLSDCVYKPDAASTAGAANGYFRFLIGTMEIKPESKSPETGNKLHVGDIAKCVLTTGCAALLMVECGVPSDRVAVPFLAISGSRMLLCVTTIQSDDGCPTVASVMSVTSSEDTDFRQRLFARLAILLGRQCNAIESLDQQKHQRFVRKFLNAQGRAKSGNRDDDSTCVKEVSKFSASAKKKCRSSGGDGPASAPGQSNAGLVKELVSFGGEICDIGFLSKCKTPHCFEEIESMLHCKRPRDPEESPYYLTGRLSQDNSVFLFCKVWRLGDSSTPPVDTVHEEIAMLELAHGNGAPVPKIWSQFSGTNYRVGLDLFHVVVLSYVEGDAVEENDLVTFALSFCQGVKSLHKCGILHCDLKPDNIRWSEADQKVLLVDLGHAQAISGALAYRATKGFEAPEIVAGMAHTIASDCYGVGATIKAELTRLRQPKESWMFAWAGKLAVKDPKDRPTLDVAISALMEKMKRTPLVDAANGRQLPGPQARHSHTKVF